MRCEICGAPVSVGVKRCEVCRVQRSYSAPPPAYVDDDDENLSQRITAAPPPSLEQNYRANLPLPSLVPDGEGGDGLPSSVVLEGKYQLVDELGRGAMGTVFLAMDKSLQREVAIKFLLPELADSPECAVRFRREAIAMASIRNDNVAQIYAFGQDNDIPYFVMEHLDGENVENIIDAHNKRGLYIPLDEILDITIQALYGLSAIHRAGAVHRDIKPANIMLTVDPVRAVIMDFGLVRNIRVEDDMRTLAGTPAYIAPELVEGKKGADASRLVDIYSLGTTLYEMLTGTIPFGGSSWVEILQKHITEVPVFPSARRPGLPEALDGIVLRAMAKEPQERYQDCEEFLEDLLEIQALPMSQDRRPSMYPRTSLGPHNMRQSPPAFGAGAGRGIRNTPSVATRGKLLVADSDADFRALVHGTAKAAVPGCRIQSATDGVLALEKLEEMRPHVLVVDLSLPEINGLELVATIRGDADLDKLAIIVVAKNGGKKEEAIMLSMGVNAFLSKPVDGEQMAQLLRPLLERPQSLAPANATTA